MLYAIHGGPIDRWPPCLITIQFHPERIHHPRNRIMMDYEFAPTKLHPNILKIILHITITTNLFYENSALFYTVLHVDIFCLQSGCLFSILLNFLSFFFPDIVIVVVFMFFPIFPIFTFTFLSHV